jgi:adenylylsulfate kinase
MRNSAHPPGLVLWFTGLSGAGKTTLARAVFERLQRDEIPAIVLDGDTFRQGVAKDLGFSDADRSENNRRAGEVAKLFSQSGLITLAAFVSPFRADRTRVREIIGSSQFVEIFVDCPLKECELRDPKKLYVRARRGEVEQFTGLTSRYEIPETPDLHLRTDQLTIAQGADRVLSFLAKLRSMAENLETGQPTHF